MRLAWLAIVAIVAFPYAVLGIGGMPPNFDLLLRGGAVLVVVAIVAIWRAPRKWLPSIALVFAIPASYMALLHAMDLADPCWQYSNATWCGHFCDDDPCACPDHRGSSSNC